MKEITVGETQELWGKREWCRDRIMGETGILRKTGALGAKTESCRREKKLQEIKRLA